MKSAPQSTGRPTAAVPSRSEAPTRENSTAVGDVLLSADEAGDLLAAELARVHPPVRSQLIGPDLLACPSGSLAHLRPLAKDIVTNSSPPGAAGLTPPLVFARQMLPAARWIRVDTIRTAADGLFAELLNHLPENQPWLLHIAGHYGAENAGANRCRLIREAVLERLQRRRRSLRRALAPDTAPLTPAHSVVQLLLTAPETGLLSVAAAPAPFQFRHVLSPFPKGHVPIASDKAAPCRAFAKLVEAERRLGRAIAGGETCVDLGASPGSWTYVALGRGAHVTAVDRAPLRAELMAHRALRFVRGDAFGFEPAAPVDWLLCDVIAAPERSIQLVRDWVARGWTRHFVVTIKFKGVTDYVKLDELKSALLPVTAEFFLQRLCANRNEACAFGSVALPAADSTPALSASGGDRG